MSTPRRLAMATVLCIGSSIGAHATEPDGEMLSRYLLTEANKHFATRRDAISALISVNDVQQRQVAMKAFLLKAIGEFPTKTPLNPKVTGTLPRAGYQVEKVVFESRSHHHVTASLYLPTNRPTKLPGVLIPCGHSQNGKAGETYQQMCILLAKQGVVVLCTDPIGQGERFQWLTPAGKQALVGSTAEHTSLGVGALLVGSSCANYRIWDEIRALDYLESREEVDGGKLGVTGNSGGGTLTAYLMAVDDRVAVAAASCYITTFERLFNTIGPQDAEQNLTGQVAAGFDHADFLTIRAPNPTMICVGTKDFFDIDGSWSGFREAKNLYGILGRAERVDIFESNEPHGFTRPRREAAARWLGRWLEGVEFDDVIDPAKIETDADLQCTKTGQVLTEFPDEVSAFTLNANRAQELAKARPKLDRLSLQTKVKELIRWREPNPKPSIQQNAEQADQGFIDQLLWVTTEPGIIVPVHFFTSKPGNVTTSKPGNVTRPLKVVIDGKPELTPTERDHLAQGGKLLKLDPRGMGTTAPAKPNYGDDREGYAFLALHLDRPLLGQRVYDVQTVLNAFSEEIKPGVELVGIGLAGPIAMHVAAIDNRVKQLTLEDSIKSWSELLEPLGTKGQLSTVVPGALVIYELEDL